MQNSTTFRTVSRSGVQLVALGAVAAVGVVFGHWVVPHASGGATAGGVTVLSTDHAPLSSAAGSSILERKFAQLERLDSAVGGTTVASESTEHDSLLERKFAQMDARDALTTGGPEAIENAPDTPSARLLWANVLERKFAQIDAEDAR